jgi:hypothetical protein
MRKLLRGILVTLALLLTGGAIGVVVLNQYLESSREKLLAELAATSGLNIAFRSMNVHAWRSFPDLSFSIDSLVLRDSLRPDSATALLTTDRLTGQLSLAALLRDTIQLREVALHGGGLYVERDSSGAFNAGRLFADEPAETTLPAAEAFLPVLNWVDARLVLRDFAVAYRNYPLRKRMAVRFDTLGVRLLRTDAGAPRIVGAFASYCEELTFNLDAGGYLTATPVSGPVDMTFGAERWIVPATELAIGSQRFTAAALIERDTTELSHIYLANFQTDYQATHALLTRKLREKMSDYFAGGTFPVQAHIYSTFFRDKNPRVELDFRLTGQPVRVRRHAFSAAWGHGTFVNRLPASAGGTPGSRKNLRMVLDSVRLRQGALHLSTPRALVTANAYDTRLEAPLDISGPARAVSDRLRARNFFFERGHFNLRSNVNASLLSFEEMVTTSDAHLEFTDLGVYYRPAATRFDLSYLSLRKKDQNIHFTAESDPLNSSFSFHLAGRIDNLAPLLIDLPGAPLRTDVVLHSPHFDWGDFLTLFGQGGYFATRSAGADQRAVRSMKQTLLGLARTFRPRVRVYFDTVAYYDVFTLRDLSTGLHFRTDTLVLEETTFHWQESDLSLAARLDLGRRGSTDFTLQAQTDHLDLNRLRGTLEHFGVAFPAGLDSLPTDLSIDLKHRGTIDDTTGIRPGTNAGTLVFDDGRHKLFSGEMHYLPGVAGLYTRIHLVGDPLIVNQLFGAEDFLFGSGQFNLELHLTKTPRDLRELLDVGRIHLHIDDSRIDYRPQRVFIPVRSFVADIADNRANYQLKLQNDSLRREIELSGELDSLSAFLFPRPGETFEVRTEARARLLDWSDLQSLVQPRRPDTNRFELQQLVSATSGIFQAFRPDLELAIDTFRVDRHTELRELFGGLSMQDSALLRLERTGFSVGAGEVRLDAAYALDDRPVSPFRLDWHVDSLALGPLLDELQTHDLIALSDSGELAARLDLTGTITGRLNETTQRPVVDSTQGQLHYRLDSATLAAWPLLQTIGRKMLMRQRFREPTIAPVAGELRIEDGRIHIPRTEIQSTAAQFFVEGHYDLGAGPDLLITIPLRNIGRGRRDVPPPPTGYAHAGWKVYLVVTLGEDGELVTRFRLGRRKYYRKRGRLDELRDLRKQMRERRRHQRRSGAAQPGQRN